MHFIIIFLICVCAYNIVIHISKLITIYFYDCKEIQTYLPRNIQAYACNTQPMCSGDFFTLTSPVIFLRYSKDTDFILHHEIAHITCNHTTKRLIVSSLIVALINSVGKLSIFSTTLLFFVIAPIISSKFLGHKFETEADAIACDKCLEQTLIEAISYLNDLEKNTDSANNNSIFDYHPAVSDRIRFIKEQILVKRNGSTK